MSINTDTSEQYEECEVCGGQIDTFDAGYFKSNDDERFLHEYCYENGEAPEGYVWEWDDDGFNKACMNHQFNCGHVVYGPPNEWPQFCPECNGLEYVDGSWTVADTGEDSASSVDGDCDGQ